MTSKGEQKRIAKMNKMFGINKTTKETISTLKQSWYFESVLDKTILMTAVILALWKLIEIVGWMLK